MEGIPLLPLIALAAGVLILIKADILNWVIALFLIGYGALGALDGFGIYDTTEIEKMLHGAVQQVEQAQ